MSSRKRARGANPQQSRLTFHSVDGEAGRGSSPLPLPGVGLSPARVGYSSPGKALRQEASPSPSRSRSRSRGGGLPVRSSPLGKRGPGAKAKARQQTLEASLDRGKATRAPRKQVATEDDDDDQIPSLPVGNDVKVRQRARAAPSTPRSSFMGGRRDASRRVIHDSGDETPAEEEGGISDSDGEGPLKQETPRGPTQVVFVSDNEKDPDDDDDEEVQTNVRSSQSLPNQAAFDDDSDDQPLVTPRSSMPGRRGRRVVNLDEEDEDEDDEELQSPAKRRRLVKNRPAHVSLSPESSEGEESVTARVRSRGKLNSRARGSSTPASSARGTRSGAPKVHRSEKQKKMELLQRRRAGEKSLTMEDLASSEDEEAGALYDTDEELQALDVFDDESEPEEEEVPARKKSKSRAKKRQPARKASPRDDDNDEDANSEDEDFIDDDDDTLGVPDEALHLIPLEFTRASRKPLKDHFRDAVEWLIHRRINPGFDKDDEVYTTAWRRLSDEVTGLANSKFISSVWRPDFHRALKARPYIEQLELGFGHLATDMEKCQACGRSGHPATWSIQFRGKPYSDKTLDEVESDSEDEDDDEEERQDRDADGNPISPEDRQFLVGSQCNSNAETAHSLMHWKAALRDWVESRLESEGWMKPERIVAREKMKARKREKLANEIAERWNDGQVVKNLFLDFKSTIDAAREKDPTKISRGARRW